MLRQVLFGGGIQRAVLAVAFLVITGPASGQQVGGNPSLLGQVVLPVAADASPVLAADVPAATTASSAPASSAPASNADERTEEALRKLSRFVTYTSDPAALRTAFQAYHNYKAARPGQVRKPYLYFVDFGLDGRTPRGYVFDMDRLTLIDGPFTVAHGRGSSRTRTGVPTSFSNRPGSKMSSLGLYLAQETYGFNGKSGGRGYRSVGLRMRGESGEFNSNARSRAIVAHGAPYVTAGGSGRSEGCPSMEPQRARRLLPMLANGGVVFIYSPNNTRWLRQDPWVNAGA